MANKRKRKVDSITRWSEALVLAVSSEENERQLAVSRSRDTPERLKRNSGPDTKGDRLRGKIVACSQGEREGVEFVSMETRAIDVFEGPDKHWYIHLTGSKEALLIGPSRPLGGGAGSLVRITLEWMR